MIILTRIRTKGREIRISIPAYGDSRFFPLFTKNTSNFRQFVILWLKYTSLETFRIKSNCLRTRCISPTQFHQQINLTGFTYNTRYYRRFDIANDKK